MRKLLLSGLMVWLLLGTFVINDVGFADSRCHWNGRWEATTGVTIKFDEVSATRVEGTFNPGDGLISGTRSGNTLKGVWSSEPTYEAPEDAGDYEISFSSNCERFVGRFRFGLTDANPWLSWSGDRLDGQEELEVNVDVLSGNLTVDGQTVNAGNSASIESGSTIRSDTRSNIVVNVTCVNDLWFLLDFLLNHEDEDSSAHFDMFMQLHFVADTLGEAVCQQTRGASFGPNQVPLGSSLFEVELTEGSLQASTLENNISMSVATDASVVKVDGGSTAAVSIDPDSGETIIAVESGSATVTPKNSSLPPVSLGSGDQVRVRDDQVSPVEPIGSTPPDQGQPEPPDQPGPPNQGGELTLAQALDTDGSGFLDDGEIRAAITMWILGETVPGTDESISDSKMLQLIQMWILGTPV